MKNTTKLRRLVQINRARRGAGRDVEQVFGLVTRAIREEYTEKYGKDCFGGDYAYALGVLGHLAECMAGGGEGAEYAAGRVLKYAGAGGDHARG